MNSKIFRGNTQHMRLQPRQHSFSYPMFWLSIDVNELDQIDREIRFFRHNKKSLTAIHDIDYGRFDDKPIRTEVEMLLDEAEIVTTPTAITLLTIPRILNYVFNPVSFFLCFGNDDRIVALIAEVRNTFGEKHHYVLTPISQNHTGSDIRFEFDKQFYVSPFFDVNGNYSLTLRHDIDSLHIAIHLHKNNELVFTANMNGTGRPLTSRSLIATLFRMPLFAATIMFKIHWQALLLRMRKHLTLYKKPQPFDPATQHVRRPSLWYRLRESIIGSRSNTTSQPDSESTSP